MRNALALSIVVLAAGCHHGGSGTGSDLGSAQGPPTDGGVVVGDGATPIDASPGDAATAPNGCGACDTPPDACHAKSGTCTTGICVYAFVDGATCDDGDDCTVADTCTNGACAGTPMVCNAAPASACVDGSTEKTYDAQGTCSGGLCVYQSHTVTCPNGGTCSGSSCSTNVCAGITCDTPPSACYAASGTCSSGSCSYAYADGATCDDGNACTTGDSCATGACVGAPTSCGAPPANTCANATTLKSYAASGTCSAADGTCSYGFSYVACPTGCSAGACKPSGWTLNASGTTFDLQGVWGVSATRVWAVGDGGTVLFYDGTKWEVVAGPSTIAELMMVHGSSASDVYALGQGELFHYDGTKWSLLATLGTLEDQFTGLWATGNATKAVYVSEGLYDGTAVRSKVLTVDSGGNVTTFASGTTANSLGAECNSPSRGLWVNGASDMLVNGCEVNVWNGSTLSPLGTSSFGGKFWSDGANDVFSVASSEFGYGSSMGRWNGTSWSTSSTGVGNVADLWGTAANNLYLVGFESSAGVITHWDGTGFTRQALPSGTGALNAVWVAPNGKVFAVGDGGTIVTGP